MIRKILDWFFALFKKSRLFVLNKRSLSIANEFKEYCTDEGIYWVDESSEYQFRVGTYYYVSEIIENIPIWSKFKFVFDDKGAYCFMCVDMHHQFSGFSPQDKEKSMSLLLKKMIKNKSLPKKYAVCLNNKVLIQSLGAHV